jgi:hypothetical protein
MRLLLALVTFVTLLLRAPAPARADADSALAWGFLAGEVSTAGIFALNFGSKSWPNHGLALVFNSAPLVVGPGVAYAAHRADLNPRPAYAIHGASMLGFDLFLLGTLIDGRSDRDGVRAGTTAWTLATMGMAGGAAIGATMIDADTAPIFYAAPTGGFVVGGIVGMVVGLIITHDGDRAFQGAVIGAASGMAIGLGASLVHAFTAEDEDEPQAKAEGSADSARTTEPIMFTIGGAF